MMYLNKWNQREIYSEILLIGFHVTCQIMNYPSKLMEIYIIPDLLVSIFHDFFHYDITF
jgi:hypothetical protein